MAELREPVRDFWGTVAPTNSKSLYFNCIVFSSLAFLFMMVIIHCCEPELLSPKGFAQPRHSGAWFSRSGCFSVPFLAPQSCKNGLGSDLGAPWEAQNAARSETKTLNWTFSPPHPGTIFETFSVRNIEKQHFFPVFFWGRHLDGISLISAQFWVCFWGTR